MIERLYLIHRRAIGLLGVMLVRFVRWVDPDERWIGAGGYCDGCGATLPPDLKAIRRHMEEVHGGEDV